MADTDTKDLDRSAPQSTAIDEDIAASLDKDSPPNVDCKVDLPIEAQMNTVLREELIATAVHFLLKARVRESSLEQKRNFLEQKGLTANEIAVAMERAASGQLLPANITAAKQIGSPYPVHYLQPVPTAKLSAWTMTRSIAAPMAILSGLAYAVYLFYKRYVEPWLFGQQKHPLLLIQESVREMTNSMDRLRETLISVEQNIKKQIEVDIAKVRPSAADALALTEVKNEVQSLKALLLNQKRFPATPKIEASIPEWQLAKSEIVANGSPVNGTSTNGSQSGEHSDTSSAKSSDET